MLKFSTVFIIVFSVVLHGGWAKKHSKCPEDGPTFPNIDQELPITPEECSDDYYYDETDPESTPPIIIEPSTKTRSTTRPTTIKRLTTTRRPIVPSTKTTKTTLPKTTTMTTTARKTSTAAKTTSTTKPITLPPSSIIIGEGNLPSRPPPDGRPTLLPWQDARQMVDSLALLYGNRGIAVAVPAPYGMIATSGAVFVNGTNAGVFLIHYSGFNEYVNPEDLQDKLFKIVLDTRFWPRSERVRQVSSKVSQLYPHRTNLVCVSTYGDVTPYANNQATATLFNVPDMNDYVLIVLN